MRAFGALANDRMIQPVVTAYADIAPPANGGRDRLMDRRVFIGGLALGTLVVPYVAGAQPTRKVYRIGILSSRSATSEMAGAQPPDPLIGALLRGLRELGYVYGEHFVTEPRGGEGKPERFSSLAAELVPLQVDVIVAAGPTLGALRQATSTIPVVTTGTGDPVASGYAKSLARPGGNITGFSLQLAETTGKRLELLKELVPGAAPVEILWDPRVSRGVWQAAESAARGREWKLADRDYHALRAHSGIAPGTRQSGKRKQVMMRYACNGRLRGAVYHWAFISMQHDEHSAATYAEHRGRGHTHGRALRGVADRLLRTLIAMLRSRTLYDPQLTRRSSYTTMSVAPAIQTEATT